MKAGLPLLALTPLLALSIAVAACVPATKTQPVATAGVPAPRPRPPAPAPAIAAVPAPTDTHWMDAPLTPGAWTYENRGTLTLAVFSGQTQFAMQCWQASGQIRLLLRGSARTAAAIRTETASRAVPMKDAGSEIPTALATLDARDPLLDAMALSKGRFAVEVEGQPPLYLPSHAEVSRVIEDCRE